LIAALLATLSLLTTFSPVRVAIRASVPTLIAISILSLRGCPGDHPGAEQNDKGKGRSRDYLSKAIESHIRSPFILAISHLARFLVYYDYSSWPKGGLPSAASTDWLSRFRQLELR